MTGSAIKTVTVNLTVNRKIKRSQKSRDPPDEGQAESFALLVLRLSTRTVSTVTVTGGLTFFTVSQSNCAVKINHFGNFLFTDKQTRYSFHWQQNFSTS
jgi:hypothetical protein